MLQIVYISVTIEVVATQNSVSERVTLATQKRYQQIMKSGIKTYNKYKEILLYGLCMAVLLLLLQWLEVRFMIINYRLELFMGAMAILFTLLGIWLALKLAKPKVETVIGEKEIYIDQPAQTNIDEKEIEKTGISKRELDVLALMASGLSNDEIAATLFVSLNTIKTHSSNIFMKLDVKRRTQAVEKAKRLNIIP